jgi:hypothetical protein
MTTVRYRYAFSRYLLLLEILAIHVLRGSIISPKHRLNSNRTLNLLGEIRPLPLRSSALIRILPKIRLIRPIIPNIPNRPPRRVNNLRQLRILEHNPREIPPRPPKVIHAIADHIPRRRRHARLVDHIPSRVIRRASGRRDPARGRFHNAKVAVLEPGLGALPEDEVCGAFDVGFGVELGAEVGEEGVLVTVEGAGVVALSLFVRKPMVSGIVRAALNAFWFVYLSVWDGMGNLRRLAR